MFRASASAFLVLALSAVTHILHVDAACESTSCGSCKKDECSGTPGCIDNSPGDYSAQYCVECSGSDCEDGGGETFDGLDPSLGCTAEDNIMSAGIMGVVGGVFLCMLPCGVLCVRAQKKWAQDFLSAPEGKVKRTSAVLNRKWIQENGAHSNTLQTMFEIDFIATRKNGASSKVCAKLLVQNSTYAAHEQGANMEVAYTADNERDFALTEDLKARTGQTPNAKIIGCFFCCFACVGLLVGVASFPLTGCFVGLIPLVLLVIVGVVAGKWCIFPLGRKLTQSEFYVTVTPQAAGAHE